MALGPTNNKRLSLAGIARMSDNEAEGVFRRLRWSQTNGEPVCPHCYCEVAYELKCKGRPLWKCVMCERQFSLTSGTIFAFRKKPARDYLLAVALFVDNAKGISSCQLARHLDCQQRSAFILAHKLREAIARSLEGLTLSGMVEIDGATFGGYRRVENSAGRFVKRRYVKKYENRRSVVVMRERGGRSLVTVAKKESGTGGAIRQKVDLGTVILADGGHAWDSLNDLFEMLRIEHKYDFAANDVHTNNAECYFSQLRRMHMGTHHKMSGELIERYAAEMAWRMDHRKLSRVEKFELVLSLALQCPPSEEWRNRCRRPRQAVAEPAGPAENGLPRPKLQVIAGSAGQAAETPAEYPYAEAAE